MYGRALQCAGIGRRKLKTVEKRLLGKTGFQVSRVSYGGIVSASLYDQYAYAGDGQAASDHFVSWAVEQGVNYFDVAPSYGNAQELMGNSIAPYRQSIYLACKTNKRTRAEAEKEMEASLKQLHTDYFDTYQLHGLVTMEELDTVFAPGGAMELLEEMKEKGYARKLGITAHTEEVAEKALQLYDFDSVLFPFNWHMNMAHGMGNRLLAAAKEKNVGILCMKSMIERAWDDRQDAEAKLKYPKSWCKPIDEEKEPEFLLAALKYVISLGVDTIIPPGNFAHFKFAVEHIDEALSQPLSEREFKLLRDRLELVKDRPFF